MLSSTHRVAKSVGSLVPRIGSVTAVSAHNLIARRFKSSDAEEDSRPYTDDLMSIITASIQSQTTGLSANEQVRMSRGNFRKGDVYKPSDLNDSKAITFTPPPKPVDELKILKLNPLDEYKNAALLSHYITPLGRLMSREQTGLSAKNQRRLSRAVRRARAMCIMSPTAKLQ
ncbi:MAG: ribosomal protein S18 [Benniella sp.]|nr:MAG: ribosomal protein S18 [Benniella sp.]